MGNLLVIMKCCSELKDEETEHVDIDKQPTIEKVESFNTIVPSIS
jgi:hypothetical protein